jgi:alkylhydroperoxidase/carboxymuconolactone decarboxylase family protein YurZ
MLVRERERASAAERAQGEAVSGARFDELESPALASGAVAAVSAKFAEGYARIREVTDRDGACPAAAKALFMAAGAAVKGHRDVLARELARARSLGLSREHADGAALATLISRGEAVYAAFAAALDTCYGAGAAAAPGERPALAVDRSAALAYFQRALGQVPGYVTALADGAPRALEGYVLMREWSLGENRLPTKTVELMLTTMNAVDYAVRFAGLHANSARRAGASEAEVVEALLCAVPIAGMPAWLTCAEAVFETPKA